LENPSPCEIRKGLNPVPHIDSALASTCRWPFDDVATTSDGVEVLSTGIHGGLVDKKDFDEWLKYVLNEGGFSQDGNDNAQAILDNKALEWAIGLLWPDQSYANMRKFRCPKKIVWVPNGYHSGRMDMLAGDYAMKFIYFVLSLFLHISKYTKMSCSCLGNTIGLL
jgi:hypothetical protein